ncbi:MAG: hypothetical protein QNI99_02440 [Woeseiaceae bacterium]|nr:hypothetical protein [Woeseiaceae bacterium]
MKDDLPTTWKVHYDADDDVVVSTIRGYATTEDLMASAVARISLGQEKGTTNFVLDTRGFLPSDRASFEAIYETVTKSYPTMFVDRSTKLAVIPPESDDARWFMDFFQSMCDSRGWNAREVANRGEARAWFGEASEAERAGTVASDDGTLLSDGRHWLVHYLSELDLVELRYQGRIDGDIVLKASSARIDMGRKMNCTRFLIDCEEVSEAEGTADAIFERVTKSYHYFQADPDSRFGVIKPAREDAVWFTKFFEKVGQDRGWNVRLFDTRADTIEWLTA